MVGCMVGGMRYGCDGMEREKERKLRWIKGNRIGIYREVLSW